MNKPLQTLLQREMTRKEFLVALGLAVASLMGFSSVIRLLNGRHNFGQSGKREVGYGAHPYGQ